MGKYSFENWLRGKDSGASLKDNLIIIKRKGGEREREREREPPTHPHTNTHTHSHTHRLRERERGRERERERGRERMMHVLDRHSIGEKFA